MIRVKDESGITEYEYGRLGEQRKIKKRLNSLVANQNRVSFESEYEYDYLGRVESIKYPDGEELVYEYNGGGERTIKKNEYTETIYVDKFFR